MKNRLNRNYFTPVFTASSLVILAACSGGGSSGNAVFDGGDGGNVNDPDPADDGDDNTPDDGDDNTPDDGDDNTPDDEGITRVGTGGIDTFTGGDAGNDLVRYTDSPVGVIIDLSDDEPEQGGYAQNDLLVSIEDIDGTEYNNSIIGDDADNRFNGFGGDDQLSGNDGDDRLNGEDGIDTLIGGDGNDTLDGGDGADIFILTLDTSLGRERITDFSVDDGDKLQIDTDDGDEDTLEALGLSVAQNGNNATVTNILFEDEVLFILDGVTHTDVTDANFDDYFDII